jgi:hypothetical protein
MINDTFAMKGDLTITVKDAATGTIKDQRELKNLVVTAGKGFIASRMAAASASVMGWIAVGTDSTAAAVGNTTLGTELARVATTVSGGTVSTNTVTYVSTFPAGTGTGALVEAGIFNRATGASGKMLCKTSFDVVNKAANDSIAITWTVTIQ